MFVVLLIISPAKRDVLEMKKTISCLNFELPQIIFRVETNDNYNSNTHVPREIRQA